MTTSTDLATTSSALAIRPEQTEWTDEQLAILRHTCTEKASPADLRVFLHRCQQLELDPFAGQAYLVDYGGKPTIQVGIHGLESIARTAADRGGFEIEWEDDQWCGPDGAWQDVWLFDDPPMAAKAVLLRDGKRYSAVALYRENVGMRPVYEGPKGNRRRTGEWEVNEMWTKRPAHMTAKVARAQALRKAFPRQLTAVYAAEELGERPDTIRGQVERVDPDPDARAGADAAAEGVLMGMIDAATTRDDLAEVWHRSRTAGLPLAVRARVELACKVRAEELESLHAAPVADEDGVVVEDPPEDAQ